ncbi:hypothetical protein [Streptosporangium carneum]|uniref:hypothetical protein n=1 Tax=Streptosporangium carneum TaxID=47481 RepID=UPI0031F02961
MTAFLLTHVVVSSDGDHETAPSSAVSAFMAISSPRGAAWAARTAAAASAVPAALAMREAETNADPSGTVDVSVRGCRHQAPSRWAGGRCSQCLSLLRGPGQRLPCAATASSLSSLGTSAQSPVRTGTERRGATGVAPSLPQLQVFRC